MWSKMAAKKNTRKNEISLTSMLSYIIFNAIELWLMSYCGEMYNKDTHKISKLSLDYFVHKLIFYNLTHFFQNGPLTVAMLILDHMTT